MKGHKFKFLIEMKFARLLSFRHLYCHQYFKIASPRKFNSRVLSS